MTTTSYFDELVKDDSSSAEAHIEFGTTGYNGQGPQVYFNFGETGLILSHTDAAKFCQQVAAMAHYLGYKLD